MVVGGTGALAGRHSTSGLRRNRTQPSGGPRAPGGPRHQDLLPSAVPVAASRQAHLASSSLQEFVSTGLSVFTMHVRADTTPAASSFFTRARTKLGLS